MILKNAVRLAVLPLFVWFAYAQSTPQHLFFHVTLDPGMQTASGRLLIFLEAGGGGSQGAMSQFRPSAMSVAAKEVAGLKPGATVDVDVDDLAFPAPFSSLKPGTYRAHAVLDVGHTYVYAGPVAGDVESAVVPLTDWTPGAGSEPTLVLNHVDEARTPRPLPLKPEELAAAMRGYAELGVRHIMFQVEPYTPEALKRLAEAVQLYHAENPR